MVSGCALITGGSRGIGAATARALAADGRPVAVNFRSGVDEAAAVVAEIEAAGGRAAAFAGDVADPETAEALFAAVEQRFGPVLVLVNNAGFAGFTPVLNITDEEWDRILAVNLSGPFYCTQAVLPDMIDAGWGRIVNISSSSAQGGQQYMAHYVSSKAGLIGLTKALALEFGPKGITVNTIPPGFVDTPMLRASEERGLLGGSVDRIAETTPVRRPGRPGDIAAACAFLVSDDAGYITGQVIGVNGGRNT